MSRESHKCISISAKAFELLKTHSIATGIPMAELVESWLPEWMETARKKIEEEALRAAAPPPPPESLVADEPTYRFICGICADPTNSVVMEPLGRNGALVAVCVECRTKHPREGGYAFDSGGTIARGAGEGNRRRGVSGGS